MALQTVIHGAGDYRFKVVPNWFKPAGLRIGNGHGVVMTSCGYLAFLNDGPDAQLILIDPQTGKVQLAKHIGLAKAHGLSLIREADMDVLYATCLDSHKAIKMTLFGDVLAEYPLPMATIKASGYGNVSEYHPSWTVHHPDGRFLILDGYGRDFFLEYAASGTFAKMYGGNAGGVPHWGPHAGHHDVFQANGKQFHVAMSDQRSIVTWSWDGRIVASTPLNGSDPRMLRPITSGWVVAHIGGKWPQDFKAPGSITFHDKRLKPIGAVGASLEMIGGKVALVTRDDTPFRHPHDATLIRSGSLFVAQYDSGDQPLVKLERF
ncbi:MAG: hypothetical protein ACKO14_07985 [Armatimonadota bacterium]